MTQEAEPAQEPETQNTLEGLERVDYLEAVDYERHLINRSGLMGLE